MVRRAVVWVAGVALVAVGARAAELPTAESIRAAAKALGPAVVDIEVKGRQAGDPGREFPMPPIIIQPPGEGRQWQWRWELPDPREGERPERRWEFRLPPEVQPRVFPFEPGQAFRLRQPRPGKGAGVLVQVDGDRGLVAAPAALVADAEEVLVRLADGRQLAAKLLGSDDHSGVGCLEVRGPNLVAARLAKADAVQVGDWVLALGGRQSGGAVSVGIVSAVNRPGEGALAGTPLLQTDAVVADDMAGGPLATLQGEMVGMTLPSEAPGRRGRQLTDVVPIQTLQSTVTELAEKGRVARGWLGIEFRTLEREVREQLGIDHGVQVVRVVEGQPAARAGIRDGDILLEFHARKVTDTEQFRAMVAALKPGTTVPVKVLRGGQQLELKVVLGERTEEGGEPVLPRGGEKLAIGVTLQALTPELAAQFGLEAERGLLVTAVEPGSPATKGRPAPLGHGDVIKEIDRQRVTTVAQAKEAMEKAMAGNAKTVLLLVRSKDDTRYIVVDLPR